MAQELIGYGHLIEQFQLLARQPAAVAIIDSAAKGRQTTTQGDIELMQFEPRYRPKPKLVAHLQFALRYEGLNLEVLALLFTKTGRSEIEANLAEKPESSFARRIAFLYEWLTGEELNAVVAPRASYVRVVDDKLQFGMADGPKDGKFRVINNLPGTRQFCPLVRKTDFMQAMVRKNLKQRTIDTLAKYDSGLLRRAAAFLYLKETHSSFEVEREKPSPDRARRFADLLREAENGIPLTEGRLVQLQNAVLDPRFQEFSYRIKQNWVGQDLGYRRKIDFVPPRPESVRDLMTGLVEFAAAVRANPEALDPIVAAAVLAFGFVFIHPFMDGNGRLHRYLIHDVLSSNGFTPKGIVLPVSAVILANLDEYIHTLEHFSKPLQARTTYNPDVPEVPATGNDAIYFRYFDATDQASFLSWAVERTVEQDLKEEISYLLGFDAAQSALKNDLDWPAHSLDLFIQLVHQNQGVLSKTKHQSHFSWMTEDEVARSEAAVVAAFQMKEIH
jgi:hypothetical protein